MRISRARKVEISERWYSRVPWNFVFALVTAALLGAASPAWAQPTFTEMVQSSPFRAFGGEMVTDVSYDGRTVVYSGDTAVDLGFLFTFDGFNPAAAPTTVQLNDCSGTGGGASGRGLSGNGEFALGRCAIGTTNRFQGILTDVLTGDAESGSGPPLDWGFGVTGLGGLTGAAGEGEARNANFDGSVIVGFSLNSGAVTEAFAWFGDAGEAEGLMQGLGFLNGHTSSSALDVSGGGTFGDTVIVGSSSNGSSEAAMWTWDGSLDGNMNPAVAGPFGLSDLAHRDTQGQRDPLNLDPVFSSTAWGVSADGGLAVGGSLTADSGAMHQAFLYIPSLTPDPLDDTMIGLGTLATSGNASSRALAVSIRDGETVVVGSSESDSPGGDDEAFIWTAGTGMIDLRAMLMAQGAQGLESWILVGADALSLDQGVDGLTVSGWGFRPDEAVATNYAWVVSGLTEITPVGDAPSVPGLAPAGLAGIIALLLASGALSLGRRGG